MARNFFFFALFFFVSVESKKVHYVHWNRASPLFRIDNTDHIVDVKEYDQVNLICPVSKAGESRPETHVVYSVSKEEYESCRITNPKPKIVAVCNQPHRLMYFTITFRSFTPTPGGLEFHPGHDYYFISTSSRDDLHRRVGGGCSTHNMRMVFKVHPNPAVRRQQQQLLQEVEEERRAREKLEQSWQRELEEPRINVIPGSSPLSSSSSSSTERIPRYRVSQPRKAATAYSQVVRDNVYYYHPRDVLMPSSADEVDRDVLDMLDNEVATDRRFPRGFSLPLTAESSSSSTSSSVASWTVLSVTLAISLLSLRRQS